MLRQAIDIEKKNNINLTIASHKIRAWLTSNIKLSV